MSGIGTATSSGSKFLLTLVFLGLFLGGGGGGADGSGVETMGSVWFSVSSGTSGKVGRLCRLAALEFFGTVVGDVDVDGHGGRLAVGSASCESCGTMSIRKSNMSLWLMAIATSDVLTVLLFKELATKNARTVISLMKISHALSSRTVTSLAIILISGSDLTSFLIRARGS